YSFVESLAATYPYYLIRLLGGLLVLGGMFVMAWNTWRTFQMARDTEDAPVLAPAAACRPGIGNRESHPRIVAARRRCALHPTRFPAKHTTPDAADRLRFPILHSPFPIPMNHEKVEKSVGLMAVLIAVVISFGGLAEIVPLMYQAETIQPLEGVK